MDFTSTWRRDALNAFGVRCGAAQSSHAKTFSFLCEYGRKLLGVGRLLVWTRRI